MVNVHLSIYTIVAARIRMARAEAKVSQEALGEMIGLSGVQVHRIEQCSRKITVADLVAIAQALKKPVSWFLGDDTGSGVIPSDARPNTARAQALGELAAAWEIIKEKYRIPD